MSEAEPALENSGRESQDRVFHHYIKGTLFRTIHVDGVIGGLTPDLGITMALFNQRFPIPQQVVFDLDQGKLGPERVADRVTKEGLVRELEVDARLSLATAKALSKWLQSKIKELEEVLAERESASGSSEQENEADQDSETGEERS